MSRYIVAFEAPTGIETTGYEEAWDDFVGFLAGHHLAVVSDLDPVNVLVVGDTTVELYEVTAA